MSRGVSRNSLGASVCRCERSIPIQFWPAISLPTCRLADTVQLGGGLAARVVPTAKVKYGHASHISRTAPQQIGSQGGEKIVVPRQLGKRRDTFLSIPDCRQRRSRTRLSATATATTASSCQNSLAVPRLWSRLWFFASDSPLLPLRESLSSRTRAVARVCVLAKVVWVGARGQPIHLMRVGVSSICILATPCLNNIAIDLTVAPDPHTTYKVFLSTHTLPSTPPSFSVLPVCLFVPHPPLPPRKPPGVPS